MSKQSIEKKTQNNINTNNFKQQKNRVYHIDLGTKEFFNNENENEDEDYEMLNLNREQLKQNFVTPESTFTDSREFFINPNIINRFDNYPNEQQHYDDDVELLNASLNPNNAISNNIYHTYNHNSNKQNIEERVESSKREKHVLKTKHLYFPLKIRPEYEIYASEMPTDYQVSSFSHTTINETAMNKAKELPHLNQQDTPIDKEHKIGRKVSLAKVYDFKSENSVTQIKLNSDDEAIKQTNNQQQPINQQRIVSIVYDEKTQNKMNRFNKVPIDSSLIVKQQETTLSDSTNFNPVVNYRTKLLENVEKNKINAKQQQKQLRKNHISNSSNSSVHSSRSDYMNPEFVSHSEAQFNRSHKMKKQNRNQRIQKLNGKQKPNMTLKLPKINNIIQSRDFYNQANNSTLFESSSHLKNFSLKHTELLNMENGLNDEINKLIKNFPSIHTRRDANNQVNKQTQPNNFLIQKFFNIDKTTRML